MASWRSAVDDYVRRRKMQDAGIQNYDDPNVNALDYQPLADARVRNKIDDATVRKFTDPSSPAKSSTSTSSYSIFDNATDGQNDTSKTDFTQQKQQQQAQQKPDWSQMTAEEKNMDPAYQKYKRDFIQAKLNDNPNTVSPQEKQFLLGYNYNVPEQSLTSEEKQAYYKQQEVDHAKFMQDYIKSTNPTAAPDQPNTYFYDTNLEPARVNGDPAFKGTYFLKQDLDQVRAQDIETLKQNGIQNVMAYYNGKVVQMPIDEAHMYTNSDMFREGFNNKNQGYWKTLGQNLWGKVQGVGNLLGGELVQGAFDTAIQANKNADLMNSMPNGKGIEDPNYKNEFGVGAQGVADTAVKGWHQLFGSHQDVLNDEQKGTDSTFFNVLNSYGWDPTKKADPSAAELFAYGALGTAGELGANLIGPGEMPAKILGKGGQIAGVVDPAIAQKAIANNLLHDIGYADKNGNIYSHVDMNNPDVQRHMDIINRAAQDYALRGQTSGDALQAIQDTKYNELADANAPKSAEQARVEQNLAAAKQAKQNVDWKNFLAQAQTKAAQESSLVDEVANARRDNFNYQPTNNDLNAVDDIFAQNNLAPQVQPLIPTEQPRMFTNDAAPAAPQSGFGEFTPIKGSPKPRYGQSELNFPDEISKYLYSVRDGKTLSAADGKMMDALKTYFNGQLTDGQIRALGGQIKDAIKPLGKGKPTNITVPDISNGDWRSLIGAKPAEITPKAPLQNVDNALQQAAKDAQIKKQADQVVPVDNMHGDLSEEELSALEDDAAETMSPSAAKTYQEQHTQGQLDRMEAYVKEKGGLTPEEQAHYDEKTMRLARGYAINKIANNYMKSRKAAEEMVNNGLVPEEELQAAIKDSLREARGDAFGYFKSENEARIAVRKIQEQGGKLDDTVLSQIAKENTMSLKKLKEVLSAPVPKTATPQKADVPTINSIDDPNFTKFVNEIDPKLSDEIYNEAEARMKANPEYVHSKDNNDIILNNILDIAKERGMIKGAEPAAAMPKELDPKIKEAIKGLDEETQQRVIDAFTADDTAHPIVNGKDLSKLGNFSNDWERSKFVSNLGFRAFEKLTKAERKGFTGGPSVGFDEKTGELTSTVLGDLGSSGYGSKFKIDVSNKTPEQITDELVNAYKHITASDQYLMKKIQPILKEKGIVENKVEIGRVMKEFQKLAEIEKKTPEYISKFGKRYVGDDHRDFATYHDAINPENPAKLEAPKTEPVKQPAASAKDTLTEGMHNFLSKNGKYDSLDRKESSLSIILDDIKAARNGGSKHYALPKNVVDKLAAMPDSEVLSKLEKATNEIPGYHDEAFRKLDHPNYTEFFVDEVAKKLGNETKPVSKGKTVKEILQPESKPAPTVKTILQPQTPKNPVLDQLFTSEPITNVKTPTIGKTPEMIAKEMAAREGSKLDKQISDLTNELNGHTSMSDIDKELYIKEMLDKDKALREQILPGIMGPIVQKGGLGLQTPLGNIPLVSSEKLNGLSRALGVTKAKDKIGNSKPVEAFNKLFNNFGGVGDKMKNLIYETEGKISSGQAKARKDILSIAKDMEDKGIKLTEPEIEQAAFAWARPNEYQMPEKFANHIEQLKSYGGQSYPREQKLLKALGKDLAYKDNYLMGQYPDELANMVSHDPRGGINQRYMQSKMYKDVVEAKQKGANPETNLFELLWKREHDSHEISAKLELQKKVDELQAMNPQIFSQKDMEFFNRYLNSGGYKPSDAAIPKAIRSVNNLWKTAQMTAAPFLGTIGRNIFGGTEANALRGTNIGKTAKELATGIGPKNPEKMIQVGGHEMTQAEYEDLAARYGVGNTATLHEASMQNQRIVPGQSKVSLQSINPVNKDKFLPYQVGSHVTNWAESGMRNARFKDLLDQYGVNVIGHNEDGSRIFGGKGAEMAAQGVRDTHYDYNPKTANTPFEQHLRNYYLPFYNFSRQNLPAMTKFAVKNPGKIIAMDKAKNAFENFVGQVDGQDPRNDPSQSRAISDKNGIYIGKDKDGNPRYFNVNWSPLTDVKESINNPVLKLENMLGPNIKIPADLTLDHQIGGINKDLTGTYKPNFVDANNTDFANTKLGQLLGYSVEKDSKGNSKLVQSNRAQQLLSDLIPHYASVAQLSDKSGGFEDIGKQGAIDNILSNTIGIGNKTYDVKSILKSQDYNTSIANQKAWNDFILKNPTAAKQFQAEQDAKKPAHTAYQADAEFKKMYDEYKYLDNKISSKGETYTYFDGQAKITKSRATDQIISYEPAKAPKTAAQENFFAKQQQEAAANLAEHEKLMAQYAYLKQNGLPSRKSYYEKYGIMDQYK
jgi:hypothetical protein